MTKTKQRPILFVNAYDDGLIALRYALFKNGVADLFFAVRTGEEALLYLQGESQYANRDLFPVPHLLLLSIHTPGMSGWDVLRWIQGRPKLASLSVLIIGGEGTESDHELADRFGANAYYAETALSGNLDYLVKRIAEFWLPSNRDRLIPKGQTVPSSSNECGLDLIKVAQRRVGCE